MKHYKWLQRSIHVHMMQKKTFIPDGTYQKLLTV